CVSDMYMLISQVVTYTLVLHSFPTRRSSDLMSAAGLLAPVLWSASDLLTRADRRRVRRCANDACLWLFIDESKAGTRRWCDMSRSEEHTSELQSREKLVCRLLLDIK